jgi:hypothetical protein
LARARKHRGSCLCGAVTFSFSGTLDDAYFWVIPQHDPEILRAMRIADLLGSPGV